MTETVQKPGYYEELDKMEIFADDCILKIARGEVASFIANFGAVSLRDDIEFTQASLENKLQPFFAELFQILPTATVVETSGGQIAFFKEFLTAEEVRKVYMISIVSEEGAFKITNIEPNHGINQAVADSE